MLVKKAVNKFVSSQELNHKYRVDLYQFDQKLTPFTNKKAFKGVASRLDLAATDLNKIYPSKKYPIVILSDGNQSRGSDFVYHFNDRQQVFPLILGDTAKVFDLKVARVNVNRFTFYENQFPVEIFLNFSKTSTSTKGKLTISDQKGLVVYNQKVDLSQSGSVVLNPLLKASIKGKQRYKVQFSSAIKEKNYDNNTSYFVIDVIDQRSKIALVSNSVHPDLSVLKRSIEKNKQRIVEIFQPKEIQDVLQDYDGLILYQPDTTFKSLLNNLKKQNKNYWLITGTVTDFDLVNMFDLNLTFDYRSDNESYLPLSNQGFKAFSVDQLDHSAFKTL